MNTPVALLVGLGLVAGSVYANPSTRTFQPNAAFAADSDDEATGKGVWAFRGYGEQLIIWKINTKSGELFACQLKTKECTRVGTN